MELQRKNQLFSLSFDEWTFLLNRRYINIHLLNYLKIPKFINLGMVRIKESMPADRCVQKLEGKINDFEQIFETDIVCYKTDATTIIKKIARIVPTNHIQCMLNGIQNVIVDVL